MDISIGIIAALVGISFFTIGDTISKFVSERFGNRIAALAIIGLSTIPALLAFLIFGVGGNYPNASQLEMIVAASVFLAVGYYFTYRSLETEQVSNTMILFESNPVIIVLVGVFALSESLTIMQGISMLAIFFGALFVTTDVRLRFNRKLLPAIFGTLCWGVWSILILYAIRGSGDVIIPTLIAKVLAFVIVAVVFLLMRNGKDSHAGKLMKLDVRAVIITLVGGLSGGLGTLVFGYLYLTNVVALGGALFALEPAFIMLFGHLFYKDRWTRLQLLGFVVMIAGAVALSL